MEVLRQRLRTGDLSEDRLAVLAVLGDEIAAAALGREVPVWPMTGALSRREQTDRLTGCGTDVLGRAGAALARAALALIADERVRIAAEAIEDWVLCPCDGHVQRAEDTGAAGAEQAARDATDEGPTLGADCVAAVALAVSRQKSSWTRAHGHTQRQCDRWTATDIRRAMECMSAAGLQPLRIVRAEVSPWLLGQRDPVRERVAAREPST